MGMLDCPALPNAEPCPAVTDYDGDGLWDLLVGSAAGKIYVYVNSGTPENFCFDDSCFILETENGPVDLGYRASIDIADLDGDGYDDILAGYSVSGDGHIAWLRSLGPGGPFRYAPPEDIYCCWGDSLLILPDQVFPYATDLNGDGGLDLIVGMYTGEVYFYQGVPGSGVAGQMASPLPTLHIFGNPVTGGVMTLQTERDCELTILDLSGRIAAGPLNISAGTAQIELTSLPAGVYTVVSSTYYGSVSSERFTLLR